LQYDKIETISIHAYLSIEGRSHSNYEFTVMTLCSTRASDLSPETDTLVEINYECMGKLMPIAYHLLRASGAVWTYNA
jgi:hypothetical protein